MSNPSEQIDPVSHQEFRQTLAAINALAMLLISKRITEGEFVLYLREAVCNIQEK